MYLVRYDAHLARLVHQIPAYLVGVLCVEIAQAHGGQVLGVGFCDADEFVEYLEVFFCFVLDVGEHGGLAFGRKGGEKKNRRTSYQWNWSKSTRPPRRLQRSLTAARTYSVVTGVLSGLKTHHFVAAYSSACVAAGSLLRKSP